jgi:hypothetical protein
MSGMALIGLAMTGTIARNSFHDDHGRAFVSGRQNQDIQVGDQVNPASFTYPLKEAYWGRFAAHPEAASCSGPLPAKTSFKFFPCE